MQALLNLFLKYALPYLKKYLIDLLMDLYKQYKRTKEQRKAVERLEKIAKDNNASLDDIGKAYEETINAGRK